MKILIIANNDVGLYRFRKELIERLISEGHDIHISLPYGKLVDELVKRGCTYINTELDRRGINPVTDLKLFFTYRRMLRSVKPDLVITYTIKPNIYGGIAARLAGKPYAMNITGLGTTFQKQGLLRKLVTALYKCACKKACVVFFENEGNKQVFLAENIIAEDRACVLNGAGVNLEDFPYREYPEDSHTTRFLFIGRVMREKGVDELLTATKALLQEGLDCSLEIVGGYEEDYLETIRRYEGEGWLKYHGFQPDVKPFIASCHCAVLPSWHEGMANTNLEAAAMGRPVITTNVYGCKEAVTEGESGFLSEAKNWENLRDVMKRFVMLSREERAAMGTAGRKYMESRFDKTMVVDKTLKRLF